MNIHFQHVVKRPQLSSYLLAAFALFIALMLVLSMSRYAGLHWSERAPSEQIVQLLEESVPVAIPAPLPPADQVQPVARSGSSENMAAVLVPQINPAPSPSVP